MQNNTKMRIAKKYQNAIEEIHSDMDGVWAYTAPGYKFESTDCHTARMDSQKELQQDIRTVTECDCDECQTLKAKADEDEDEETSYEIAGQLADKPIDINGEFDVLSFENPAIDKSTIEVTIQSTDETHAGILTEHGALFDDMTRFDAYTIEALEQANYFIRNSLVKVQDEVEEAEAFIDDHIEIITVSSEASTADDAIIEADEAEAEISVWVGSLGAYNGGRLIGEWLNLPMDEFELNDAIAGIITEAGRVTGEAQEEYTIMDIECNIEGIGNELSRYGLSQLNAIAEDLADLDEDSIENIAVVNEVQGDIVESINVVADAIILDDVNTDEELAETLHEMDMLHIEIPPHLENYIDFESIGRDYRLGGEWYISDAGKAVSLP